MKQTLLALACLLPMVAHAADGDFARQTAATQLVDVINGIVPYEAMLQEERQLVLAKYGNSTPCAEQTLVPISKLLGTIYNYNVLRPSIIESYATNFSFHELNDITSFYRSQSGQSFLRKQTQLRDSLRMEASKKMAAKQVELTAIVTEFVGPDGKCKIAQGTL